MNLNSPRQVLARSIHQSNRFRLVADKAAEDAFWALHQAGYVIIKDEQRGAPARVLAAARRSLLAGLSMSKKPERELVICILDRHHEMFPEGDATSRCSCGWHATNVAMTHQVHAADELVRAIKDT